APLDGVLFAASAPVDALVKAGLVDGATRRIIATNTLVLVGPKSGPRTTFASLAELKAGEKIAIGDPRTVPVGQYAKDALQKLAVWDKIQDRLVLGGDVAATLVYARRGEVAVAIVYSTDL